MTRDQLIETMARAMWKDDYGAMLHEAREYSGQPNGESAWREVEWMREAAAAALTAVEAAGMRVVPVEPTASMIRAGDERWLCDEYADAIYRAMVLSAQEDSTSE
jgi:hypothetical protein